MRPMLYAGIAAMLFAGSALAQPVTGPEQSPPAVTAPDTTAPKTTNPALEPSAPIAPPSSATALPPANEGPSNPAIKTTPGNNPGAPVAGANSFTEGQAKSRIEGMGYSNVSSLSKDGQGIWRGKADKDGKSFDVSLDYQGNIVVR